MKYTENKEMLLAIGIGLLVGFLFSIPLLYQFNLFSSVTTTKPALGISPLLVDETLFSPLPKEVANFIRIPIDLAEKNKKLKAVPVYKEVDVRVSFYTSLARENGGYAKMNALGGYLKIGSLAAPKDIPFGTTFIIPDLPDCARTDTFIVDDRGSAIHWVNPHLMKVDVYITQEVGETDDQYFKRVNDLGIIYTKAKYIVK